MDGIDKPVTVIALRELSARWREHAEISGAAYAPVLEEAAYAHVLEECADDLDALLARVESPPQEQEQLRAQKDAAYAERDQLVAALSKLWPAHLARHPDADTAWENDWRWIVCVHSPVGQLTWHIHDSERDWFNHLEVRDGDWDGHATDEKYARLAILAAHHAPPTEPTE